MSGKSLIAYFTREGYNYVSGNIVSLPVGNTEVAAKMLQRITEADLFRIEAVKPYPEDYTKCTEVAKEELQQNARPDLTSKVDEMDSYDVIFLGYPNWWGTFPMAVFTFLETYDLSGKKVIPFCTHEGSGMGRSESDIKKLCTSAKVEKGLAIKGSNVEGAEKEIFKWAQKY
ncbi:NAD(P)H-dependent oxidoreductase [Clostridium sp. YIM B02505]|uniref:NAD(P)H-dependent oxidoreductase n=1 Tax=Clostridium yunnanense TaxID=2800325 RepID=A0ABS1ES44_9CLOT|nr:flavodoxin [Clostridium yunnanense]MBK1812194.1 NAD(P)H-dependent oxidoreductase [Clostridium yunnanense]